jgi:hypothetical protein
MFRRHIGFHGFAGIQGRRLLVAAAGLAAIVILFGCTQPGGSTPPSASQAQTMNTSVIAAINAALSTSGTPALSLVKTKTSLSLPTLPKTTSFPIYGNGYTINGTENTTGNPQTFDLTITFNNYTYQNVTLTSGSATINVSYNTTTNAFTGSYTGSFDIMYQGQSYTYSWNITFSYDGVSVYSFNGTFVIDGTTYTYSYST